jgi:hypothetical protein
MKEEEMKIVASFLKEAVDISLSIQKAGGKMLKDFLRAAGEGKGKQDLEGLGKKVAEFAVKWPLPGVVVSP